MNSISLYWKMFQNQNLKYRNINEPKSLYYCDNKKDADECAELVVNKIKQATSTSIWWFEKHDEKLPHIGDLAIVTNWDGEAKAIIKTIKVDIVKYKDITKEYAIIEGEGDKSLNYWKGVHWEYYKNEMNAFEEYPTEDMEILREYFETIWS